MARPLGRSIKPNELAAAWLNYATRCRRFPHTPETLAGFADFHEVKKTRTTILAMIRQYGFGRVPPIPKGGFLFLLAFEPPHDILWASDATYDLAGRATTDLRDRIDVKWSGTILDVDHHRQPATLILRRGVDVDQFLSLKVIPLSAAVKCANRGNRLAKMQPDMPPHTIMPASMLDAGRPLSLFANSPYARNVYTEGRGELVQSHLHLIPWSTHQEIREAEQKRAHG